MRSFKPGLRLPDAYQVGLAGRRRREEDEDAVRVVCGTRTLERRTQKRVVGCWEGGVMLRSAGDKGRRDKSQYGLKVRRRGEESCG